MLTPEERGQLRDALLDAERKLLQNAQKSLELSRDRAADTGRDSIDLSVSEEMLSTDLRLRDREKKLLGKIRGAVSRLEEGTIDECEDCGEEIPEGRRKALPGCTRCVPCQQGLEVLNSYSEPKHSAFIR